MPRTSENPDIRIVYTVVIHCWGDQCRNAIWATTKRVAILTANEEGWTVAKHDKGLRASCPDCPNPTDFPRIKVN